MLDAKSFGFVSSSMDCAVEPRDGSCACVWPLLTGTGIAGFLEYLLSSASTELNCVCDGGSMRDGVCVVFSSAILVFDVLCKMGVVNCAAVGVIDGAIEVMGVGGGVTGTETGVCAICVCISGCIGVGRVAVTSADTVWAETTAGATEAAAGPGYSRPASWYDFLRMSSSIFSMAFIFAVGSASGTGA